MENFEFQLADVSANGPMIQEKAAENVQKSFEPFFVEKAPHYAEYVA